MSRTPIISELQEISPLVAKLSPAVPYLAPPFYFEQLPEQMLQLVQDDPLTTFLPVGRPLSFSLPPGYFDQLADTVLARIKADEAVSSVEETRLLSPLLASLDRHMKFDVPADYFSRSLPVFGEAADTSPAAEQENGFPAFLAEARNQPTYEAPAGYFARFPDVILHKVAPAPAKVVAMQPRQSWMRYAVAASVAAVVAVSGWFYFRVHSDPNAGKNELAYIKNVSSNDLQDFVDKNTIILPESSPAASVSDDLKTDDVKIMLAGVPDEELQQYIDQQPQVGDPGADTFN